MTTTPQKPAEHKGYSLTEQEHALLKEMRRLRREREAERDKKEQHKTMGQHLADRVAAIVGSWSFIIVQTILLALWIIANIMAWHFQWDPYPFILLNLMLSFQAAFTAPVIMMSQNRQAEIDREDMQNDYEVNRKAELEVEALHEKMDILREQQISELLIIVKELNENLKIALKN